MQPFILLSTTACLFLASSPSVLVTASGYSQPVAVNAYEMITRTVQERAAVWANLGFDLQAALNPQSNNDIPTVVVGPGNNQNQQQQPQTAAAKQAQAMQAQAAPEPVQQAASTTSQTTAQGSNAGNNAGGGGAGGGGGTNNVANAGNNVGGNGSNTTNNNAGSNNGGGGAAAASNAGSAAGANDAGIGTLQIDDGVANQIADNKPRGPPKEDKVGGIGGDGTGETASDDVVSAFYDAKTGDELYTIVKDLQAKSDGKADPSTLRPIYVSHETATAAYQKWTGKKEADPCKGDVVKEVVFPSSPTCMQKIGPGNIPAYVGYPALRRREPCFFTNVRCIDKKALILSVDALNKTIIEQTGPRRGDYWYSGRTFARPDVVNKLYRLLYPNSINDPKKNVCANTGPDEFGSEYSLGAVLAIFAESEKCLTAPTNTAGTACRRVAVDCIGKWNPT